MLVQSRTFSNGAEFLSYPHGPESSPKTTCVSAMDDAKIQSPASRQVAPFPPATVKPTSLDPDPFLTQQPNPEDLGFLKSAFLLALCPEQRNTKEPQSASRHKRLSFFLPPLH